MLVTLISFWTHALAAVLFTSLALWRLQAVLAGRGGRTLVTAIAATALWAWLAAIEGSETAFAPLAESVRNLLWLGFTSLLMRDETRDERQRGARVVFFSIAGIVVLQLALDIVPLLIAASPAVLAAIASTGHILRITTAAGALVLVHNLYGQAAPEARGAIRLPMIGLASLWLYDLNLYTVAYLFEGRHVEIAAMRGAIVAATAPLFALASRRPADWRIKLSRAATFQSLSLAAICAYFVVMTITASAGEATGWAWVRGAQVVLLVAMTAVAAVLIPSGRARAWLRVTITKHLFQHRYDYRGEWLRFTRLMGEAKIDAAPLGERAVKAIADIVEAPAGLLLAPDDGGRLEVASRWNWADAWRSGPADMVFGAALARDGRIVDFAALRAGTGASRDRATPVPEWMLVDESIWAAIPLIHEDRLAGLVLLAAPPVMRALDWEDFDLLRTAARGAASYLAEARGQEALAETERFSEFNRRFAFILHDIKNLVSGLSLLARNAERHAGNPEFRNDMVATLKTSVDKMNHLLLKLTPRENLMTEAPRPLALAPLLTALVAGKSKRHDVRLLGDVGGYVLADPHGLEEALGHLVDNAVDASAPDAPVLIKVAHNGDEIGIAVIDHGPGMSADFVRKELFQPFSSTKANGFGIGAHQARALVTAMGGSLAVDSRQGAGTRFTVCLPSIARGALAA